LLGAEVAPQETPESVETKIGPGPADAATNVVPSVEEAQQAQLVAGEVEAAQDIHESEEV
jgi:hypothetical protein